MSPLHHRRSKFESSKVCGTFRKVEQAKGDTRSAALRVQSSNFTGKEATPHCLERSRGAYYIATLPVQQLLVHVFFRRLFVAELCGAVTKILPYVSLNTSELFQSLWANFSSLSRLSAAS